MAWLHLLKGHTALLYLLLILGVGLVTYLSSAAVFPMREESSIQMDFPLQDGESVGGRISAFHFGGNILMRYKRPLMPNDEIELVGLSNLRVEWSIDKVTNQKVNVTEILIWFMPMNGTGAHPLDGNYTIYHAAEVEIPTNTTIEKTLHKEFRIDAPNPEGHYLFGAQMNLYFSGGGAIAFKMPLNDTPIPGIGFAELLSVTVTRLIVAFMAATIAAMFPTGFKDFKKLLGPPGKRRREK